MNVIIDLPATDAIGRCFLTWVPVSARVHIENGDRSAATHRITLRNAGTAGGGKVIFNTTRSDDGTPTLTLDVPSDPEAFAGFWVAGEFGVPSIDYGDAVIEAVDATGQPVGSRKLMVRIRKNAVKLTPAERTRFLEALGRLNNAGKGPFQSFRDMHGDDGYPEEHSFAGFLPWHRAYLLDLERSLQELDASVTLPYWRFDEPAPALFAPDFFGMPDSKEEKGDVVLFPHGHPLEFWRTDGADAIIRRPTFDITVAPPQFLGGSENVISQDRTMAKGGPAQEFYRFRRMEGTPHGAAHTSFSAASPITNPSTAPKDPLFFLLHCNVDRLWAFWQWRFKRIKEDEITTYSLLGSLRFDQTGNVGALLDDSMWPWNGIKDPPRPGHAPRPTFPPSPFNFDANPDPSAAITGPGDHPIVRAMIDFQGIYTRKHLMFGYDDVPFELEPEVVA